MSQEMTQEQIEQLAADYHRLGYVKLSNIFSLDDVREWQDECERLNSLDLVKPDNKRTPFRMGSHDHPEKIDPVVDISPLFKGLTQDARITRLLHAIFNDDALLFKDKIIYKDSGVEGYKMHQDWAWGWQLLAPAEEMLSVSFQIDGADVSNGCIELFDGYHSKLMITAGEERNFTDEEIATLIDPKRGGKIATLPGDVLIFHSLTPHQSGKNVADYPRRSLYLTYNAARSGDLREEYYRHYIDDMAARDRADEGVFI